MTLTSGPSAAIACRAASTAAAPPISDFIASMDFAGLSDSPPESKVMPFPASTTVLAAPGRREARRTSRGGGGGASPPPGGAPGRGGAAGGGGGGGPGRGGPPRPLADAGDAAVAAVGQGLLVQH